jgi:hypothetical protein
MQASVCHTQKDYAFAYQLWCKERQLFELEETERLNRLNKALEDDPPFTGFIVFLYACLTAGSIIVGCHYGAGTGWGLFFVGMIPVALLLTGAQKLGRWQARHQLVRRSYPVPEPIYEPRPSQEEQAQRAKEEEWERQQRERYQEREHQERQRKQQTQTESVTKITSLRQAIEACSICHLKSRLNKPRPRTANW